MTSLAGFRGEVAACEDERAAYDRAAKVLPWIARARPIEERVQPAAKKAPAQKNWLQRLLSPDPADPRRAPRLRLSWVEAYFFTGGRPEPHKIRDISATGVYVVTDDRWYLGTVVRITLVDQRWPTADRSFTVHAKVVRWGEDGAGLAFVLNEENGALRGKANPTEVVAGVDRTRAQQFLERVRERA
jgi:hypothetical protein